MPDDATTAVGVVSVGYRRSDDLRSSARRGRRPLEEVAHFGRWNGRASLSGD